jgi:two-component system chemotaxis response regulator CheY
MAPSVLIVDDALFMRMMIKDILSKDGFEVVGEAENGIEAVKKYAELRPNLVTMDIVMPEMDGIEAVRNIIRIDPLAKVLMCSAMGQQPLVVEALEAGAKDFIIKPFQPAKVVEAVRKALQNDAE